MANHIPKGITKRLRSGEELVFKQILLDGNQTSDIYYYEKMTDIKVMTPSGEEVLLNSLGIVGAPPMVYFAFIQEVNNDIFFYGNIIAQDPTKPETIKAKEWVVEPSCGRCLNYPGSYSLDDEWDYKFKIATANGEITSVELHNIVVDYVKISTGMGEFWTYKINAYDQNGKLDSESWFSTQLGVNVKRISYSEIKPGYELTEYNVV